MNKEREINIENLGNPIVKIDLIAKRVPNVEAEMHLNQIAFGFNTQVPDSFHGTGEVQTLDASYRLTVWVDEEHLEEFKNYMKAELGEENIIFC